jgi:hypothetical protein
VDIFGRFFRLEKPSFSLNFLNVKIFLNLFISQKVFVDILDYENNFSFLILKILRNKLKFVNISI